MKVLITGPECSGKTELALSMAKIYGGVHHPEFAVEYLQNLDHQYKLPDLQAIYEEQERRRQSALSEQPDQYHFFDTGEPELIVWAQVRFNAILKEVHNQLKNSYYDLILLCTPDLKWKPAPFRENPDDRDLLFLRYKRLLDEMNLPLHIIKGHKRAKKAVQIINAYISA